MLLGKKGKLEVGMQSSGAEPPAHNQLKPEVIRMVSRWNPVGVCLGKRGNLAACKSA